MADLNKIVEDLSSLTVLEAAELSKLLEEKWGVSAAAPVIIMKASKPFLPDNVPSNVYAPAAAISVDATKLFISVLVFANPTVVDAAEALETTEVIVLKTFSPITVKEFEPVIASV